MQNNFSSLSFSWHNRLTLNAPIIFRFLYACLMRVNILTRNVSFSWEMLLYIIYLKSMILTILIGLLVFCLFLKTVLPWPWTFQIHMVWVHITSQTWHFFFFIKVHVPSQESERLRICAIGIDFASFYHFNVLFFNLLLPMKYWNNFVRTIHSWK
jgi:hypothetical protein